MKTNTLESTFQDYKVQEHIREAMNYELRKIVSSNVFRPDNFRIEMLIDPITRDAVFSFKGIVYGSKIKTENIIKVPDGKLAMFKLSLFPEWLLKKFPPKMKEIAQVITIHNSYPGLPIQEPVMRWNRNDF